MGLGGTKVATSDHCKSQPAVCTILSHFHQCVLASLQARGCARVSAVRRSGIGPARRATSASPLTTGRAVPRAGSATPEADTKLPAQLPKKHSVVVGQMQKKKKKPQFKSLCSVAWGTVEVGNLFAMAATCSTFHVRHFLHEAIQRQRVRVGVHIQIAEPRLFRVAILPSRGNTRCAHCTGPGPSCTGTCLGFPANICYNRCATALLTKVVQCPL